MFYVFFFVHASLIGQTCEIIYRCNAKYKVEYILKRDAHKISQKSKEQILSLKDIMDSYFVDFILSHEKNVSNFFPKSAETNIVEQKIENGKRTYYLALKDDKYQKDFNKKIMLNNIHAHGRTIYIRDSFINFCWNFTSEKKEILGYTCSKAIINDYHGQEITAWYASEIPIPNGPIEFGGLPGMILELTTNQLRYKATEIKLNPKERTKIEPPKQKEKQVITMAEFFEKTKKVKSFGKKGK